MKNTTCFIATFITTILLTSCTTSAVNRDNVTRTTHDVYPPKNPQTVSWYMSPKQPDAAYRVIGTASVSKYNLLGGERKNETIHAMLQNLAASIGGDGLIDELNTEQDVQATVIAYQKILI